MRILVANVKLLCQCVFRWWTVTGLAVILVLLCLFPDLVNPQTVLAALLLVPLGLGIAIASLQGAVTGRVELFCLPRPHAERRRLALLLGLLAAFGAMLVFIGYANRFDIPPGGGVLAAGALFSASLLLCLSGAAAPLLVGCVFVGGPMILSGIISLFAPSWPSVSTLLECAIVHHPGGVIAVGMVGAAISWFWLARPINDLRYPRTRPSTKRTFTQRFCANALEASERRDAIHPRISVVLLERMRCSSHSGYAKHVWSSLYLWLHPRGGGRTALIAGAVLGALLGGFSWYMSSAFYIIFGIVVLFDNHRWPVYSRLLTVGGRRERFISTMVQLAIVGGVFTLSVVFSFVTVDALHCYLREPVARALDAKLGRMPLGLGAVLLMLTLVPLGCLAQMAWAHLFRRGDSGLWFAAFLLAIMAGSWKIEAPFIWGATALVFSWAFCVAGVYCIVRRTDLFAKAQPEPTFSSLWRAICETVTGQQDRGGRCGF